MMLLQGKRIFIVEDNIHNRTVYRMLLIREGAEVEFERFGRDVPILLDRFGACELVILDLMLPTMTSGYTIFTQIRAIPKWRTVPILAVSASEPEESIARTRAMGFSGFIAKPIDEALFVNQVVRTIAGEAIWYGGISPVAGQQ
jgi:CheY-like chemotaxis protein